MSRKHRGREVSGILVLDKPEGESSNRSLQNVKRLFNAAKAGHTGSLDPLATGVLPLCFGEATKISQFLLDSDKAYHTTIKLGVKTASGDSEGDVLNCQNTDDIKLEDVQEALLQFRGEIEQIPSMFSALKHKGTPLYKLARQGKTVERKVRRVNIFQLELLDFSNHQGHCEIKLAVECSKGTYIRSIADDLGDSLGVGGHVIALRRTKAGPFTLSQALTYKQVLTLFEGGGFSALDEVLQPADSAIQDLPEVFLPELTANHIKQGQAVIVRHLPTEGLVRMYSGELFLGIGKILEDGRLTTSRLFNYL